MQGLKLVRYDRPDTKAQSAAMAIMTRAFDPSFGEAWTAAQLSGMLTMPGTWMTLARLEGAVLGFAVVRSIVDESELLLLAVDPGWQGRAIGQALLTDCLARARALGMKSMHLEVRSTNNAIALYTKSGFFHVNTRPDYYRGADGHLYDALSYRIDI